jgi:hypothetical protein
MRLNLNYETINRIIKQPIKRLRRFDVRYMQRVARIMREKRQKWEET